MVDGNAVYISFNRGEDAIRHSFFSHLSAEFHSRGVSFFACEEDPASDDRLSSEESDAAIAKARVSVVILSEKFASSKRCLDELWKVFECRRNNNLVVVPVFYGLTKSVLKQRCLELVKLFPTDSVADWRRALLEIADLPNHASSDKRSDSELVEEIVADVRQKLDRTSKIGIYSRLMKIENLFCKQPWGVQSLGIWGMGGIGKTTLAEAAFEQLSGDFEASCLIQDFSRDFKKKGVYGLLVEHFGKELAMSSSRVTILSRLRDKLCHKRILLVLDDVHKAQGAATFLGWFDSLVPGSLIIITSRDKQVLVQCCVNEIYEAQGLNEHEALQLFSRCAFGKDVPDQNLLELSKKLVDYANGNPLALSIYGGKLKGKNPSEMETAVLEYKGFLPDEIFDVFKSSYDALSDSEKNIFLDIACFFRGENVDNVMQLLAGCGFFARVGIDVLVGKSLVTVSENRVQMHTLIHKVGLKIIRSQAEDIGKAYRLLDASNIQSLLEEKEVGESKATRKPDLQNEDIEALILDTSNLAFEDHIGLEEMYNLRYLKIYSSYHTEHSGLCLPNGLQSLPSELRLLHWENYPLKSFPQDFDIQHLVELNMPNSQLEKLWEGTKNLEMLKRIRLCHSQQLINIDGLQYSRNVELVDLQGCSMLHSFPDTSQLQHLEVVNLSTCVEMKSFPKVPPSIRKLYLQGTDISEVCLSNPSSESRRLSNAAKHENSHLEGSASQVKVSFSSQDIGKLVFLKLKDCSHLRSLPDMDNFESLELLDLSGCSELEEIQGFPRNLKKLYLAKTAIREIPSLLCCHISKLVTLDMKSCKRLRDLPMGMSNMKSLATLKLSGCSKLENIRDLPRNLKELYLSGTAVKVFPSSLLENLSKLVTLDMENCKKLQHLPMGMSKLKSLVTLKLSGCSELEDIHDFPLNLQKLYLAGTAIRELPSSIGDLAELDTLDLKSCKRLQYLPVEMRNLNPLKVYDVSGCAELEAVMPLRANLTSSFLRFYAQLVTLCLYKACLEYIPEEICWMFSLKTLDLSGNGFRTIPVSIKEFPKLFSLRLRYCKNLRSLPLLPRSLQLLNAHGCLSLRSIPLDFDQLPRYYTFSNCFQLSPQMVNKILVKALAIVEYMEQQRHQELKDALAFSFCVPSLGNRNSTLNLQPQSSVMIRLPPYWKGRLKGFAIFVEVAFSMDFHEAAGLGFRCVCRWNDKEGHSHRYENTFHCWASGEAVPKIQKDHLFVFCDLKMHPVIFEGDIPNILADLVVFELFPVNKHEEKRVGDSCRVTKFGVSVINDTAGSSSLEISPPVYSLDAVELPDDEVKEVIKARYAGLHVKNKALFLYMACLFNDEKVDSLAPCLASIDSGVCSGLSDLAAWSLIQISSNSEIVMHRLQRQFSRDIVRRESMLPGSSNDVMGLSHDWKYDAAVSFSGKDVSWDDMTTLMASQDCETQTKRSDAIDSNRLVELSQKGMESEITRDESLVMLKKVSTTEKEAEKTEAETQGMESEITRDESLVMLEKVSTTEKEAEKTEAETQVQSNLWKYDALVSFSGKDVIRDAISLFLKICKSKGIRTLKEHEVLNSRPSIQDIRESRVAVVVFSKKYASSISCLNELVEIMKYREELGQRVMPVFYNVKASDVRKQRGGFGKNFMITCKNNTIDNEKRQSWRRALTDAANIAGESSWKWKPKAAMFEKVIDDMTTLIASQDCETHIKRLDAIDSNRLVELPQNGMESERTRDESLKMLKKVSTTKKEVEKTEAERQIQSNKQTIGVRFLQKLLNQFICFPE